MPRETKAPDRFAAWRKSLTGLGVTSLLLGIIAALTCWMPFLAVGGTMSRISLVCAVLGITLGASCVWAAFTGPNSGVRVSVSGLLGLTGLIVSAGSLIAFVVVQLVIL